MALTCPRCGSNAKRTAQRKRFRYLNAESVSLNQPLRLPRCCTCRHVWLDERAKAVLAKDLAEAYRAELRQRIQIVLPMIDPHMSQAGLERLLGLSQGYLSRLRGGAGTPSSELVSNLALIAADPPVRLRELERFWRAQVADLLHWPK